MLVSRISLSVIMRRCHVEPAGADRDEWCAVAVTTAMEHVDPVAQVPSPRWNERIEYVEPMVVLQLDPDDCDGAFANWASSEPKVFVHRHLIDGVARPVRLSAGDAAGARGFDSSADIDSVPVPRFVHAWLGAALSEHRRSKPARQADRPMAGDLGSVVEAPA